MIPTYNCAGYLRETLASVLAQGPGPDQMQIEVVDDCSTDDPQAIVDELAPTRVSFHQQPENRGHTPTSTPASNAHAASSSTSSTATTPSATASTKPSPHPSTTTPTSAPPSAGTSTWTKRVRDLCPRLHEPTSGIFPDAAYRLRPASGSSAHSCRPEVDVRTSGGFDRRLRVAGEDLEMWVRIAAHYPAGTRSNRWPATTAGRGRSFRARPDQAPIRDYRLTIDLVTEYIEPGRRASAHRAARRRCAEWALVQARALAAAGDRSAALVQLREALLSDHSPRVALRAAKTAGRMVVAGGERDRL